MSIFSQLGDLKKLKEQAGTMQAMLAQEIVEVNNNSLKLIMNGKQEILELKIITDNLNKESLEKDIKSALKEALNKIQKIMVSKASGLM